ncbi:hypothetical protein KY362_07175, partial [Candidatus Woesearchaeota archaeon]|nr:hypothetical protein [Candidatus Woesearchaeota archaeon]
MSKQRKELRILLCQVRQEQAMLDHELDCFARAGDLRKEQFVQLDLLKSLEFDMLALKIFDAIVVGGSGDYGVPEFVKTFPIGAAMLGMILQQAKQD